MDSVDVFLLLSAGFAAFENGCLYFYGFSILSSLAALIYSLAFRAAPKPSEFGDLRVPLSAQVRRLMGESIEAFDRVFADFDPCATGEFLLMFALLACCVISGMVQKSAHLLFAWLLTIYCLLLLKLVILRFFLSYQNKVRPRLQSMRARSLVEFAKAQRLEKARYVYRAKEALGRHLPPFPRELVQLVLDYDATYRRARLAIQ